MKKRKWTELSLPRKTKKAPKGYVCPWGGEHHTLFLVPPARELPGTVQTVTWKAGKGVKVVPVRKREIWFWSLGEIAVDWWDIPKGESIFLELGWESTLSGGSLAVLGCIICCTRY